MKTFAPLYKQTVTGKIQKWIISVEKDTVITEYGQVDGKKQTTRDIIKAGKNIGRANATTIETQALAQAQQTFDAKLKDGYVEDIAHAKKTKNTLQAIAPMLAYTIEQKEKYVVFPALAQPKLDGLRCIAIIKQGKVKLFSRSQKEYLTVPHIAAELERLYPNTDITLDGELYNHEYKDSFNTIIHLAKRDGVHADHTKIEYHIYDVISPGSHAKRMAVVRFGAYCKRVNTVTINSRAELEVFQTLCIEQGYEGCMYRHPTGEYEHKRSNFLLKVKTFQDDEFKIIGAEEGTGKLMGAIGAFVLITKKGVIFKAKPACTLEQSREYWRIWKNCVDRKATVKFQNYTPDGAPRFPVFKCIHTN